MSLTRNLAWSYFGQAFSAAIGIVMLPVYIRYLGTEAYGLVGFYTMLQAWLLLLDFGLTPTLSRELSRTRAGVLGGPEAAAMIQSIEWLFAGLGAAAAAAIAGAAPWIASRWLKADQLPVAEIRLCVSCMGVVIASRWLVGLYRGALAGLEEMVPLNAAGAALAAVRSVGVVAVFWAGFTRPGAFFLYQVGAALLEVAVMRSVLRRRFRFRPAPGASGLRALRGMAGIAGSMAFLAGLWIVINQADKLVLSWSVDLQRYGCYMVAVTLAGGITLLAAPLNQALQPRLTVLAAQGGAERLKGLYRLTTQAAAAGGFAIAGVMACQAEPLLLAWTVQLETARASAPILALYAIGNAIAGLLGIAFMLQFAFGKLRWHVIGNGLFAAVWFPAVVIAARRSGTTGVAAVWLVGNAAYLVAWLPGIHRRLIPELWWRWVVQDILLVAAADAAVLLAVWRLPLAGLGRTAVLAILAAAAAAAAAAGLLAGSETRPMLLRWLRRGPAAKLA